MVRPGDASMSALPGSIRLACGACARQLRGFDLVYDLQTSRRSSRYFGLAGRPRWSGIAAGAALPHDNPRRNDLHTVDRQRDQFARAGVPHRPAGSPGSGFAQRGRAARPVALCAARARHLRWPMAAPSAGRRSASLPWPARSRGARPDARRGRRAGRHHRGGRRSRQPCRKPSAWPAAPPCRIWRAWPRARPTPSAAIPGRCILAACDGLPGGGAVLPFQQSDAGRTGWAG